MEAAEGEAMSEQTAAKDDWFRVEVTDRNGQIVAIESEMLSGSHIGDSEEATINTAISHLTGFVGPGFVPTRSYVHAAERIAKLSFAEAVKFRLRAEAAERDNAKLREQIAGLLEAALAGKKR